MDKYKNIKAEFERLENKEQAIPMEKYLRNRFKCYGLKTKERREIYKEIIDIDKKAGVIDWDFLDLCFKDEYRDLNYLVLDYLIAQRDILKFEDISRLENYVKYNQWWDSIDVMSGIIGNIGLKDKRLDNLMLEWSNDEDFWIRRIAIIHQLLRKDKTDVDLLEKILINNFGSREFFINKAIGWALRDYSKTDPEWVKNFVEEHSSEMSNLSIKEGSKYI